MSHMESLWAVLMMFLFLGIQLMMSSPFFKLIALTVLVLTCFLEMSSSLSEFEYLGIVVMLAYLGGVIPLFMFMLQSDTSPSDVSEAPMVVALAASCFTVWSLMLGNKSSIYAPPGGVVNYLSDGWIPSTISWISIYLMCVMYLVYAKMSLFSGPLRKS